MLEINWALLNKMDENNKNITLYFVGKELWAKKFLFLILFLSTTLLLFLGIFFYSSKREILASDFSLSFFNLNNGLYPDSSTFDYTKIVSIERLEKVKNDDPKFAGVDVELMDAKKDIIIKNVIFQEEDTPNFRFTGYPYTLSVNGSYFKNSDLGQDFILALINLELVEIENRTRSNLPDYLEEPDTNNLEYGSFIEHLRMQYKELIERYNSILRDGLTSVTFDGKRIVDKVSSIQAEFKDGNIFDILDFEVEKNRYVRDESKRLLEAEIYSLEKETQLYAKNIADLTAAFPSLPDNSYDSFNYFYQQITSLNATNQELEILKDIRDNSQPVSVTFEKEIEDLEKRLIQLSHEYEPTYVAAILDRTILSFIGEVNPMYIDKPISNFLIILISVVMGIVVGGLGIYFKFQSDKNKKNKEEAVLAENH